MSSEAERIGVVGALEPRRTQLREAFDVVAEGDKRADAGGELGDGPCTRRRVEGTRGGPETQAGDLAGARTDGEMHAGLVVVDDRFDVGAGAVVFSEDGERFGREEFGDEGGDALTRGFRGLLHRVRWEEVAQEDPEPIHALTVNRRRARLNQTRSILQIRGAEV